MLLACIERMSVFGPNVKKGQVLEKISREEFRQRYLAMFADPRFQAESAALARLEEIAYQNFSDGRKAPFTEKAGAEFSDPEYDLSVEWLSARARIKKATERFSDASSPSRVLVVCASDRNDGTCPGEMSKSFRLANIVIETIAKEEGADTVETDLLDLSLMTSEYGKTIHPCKGCVSTAMPLCHWPCSCYPNPALGQVNDWMNEIYERWALAHAVVIVTPVYWYQAPSALKLMMDRMVCADGGNPDPTSTHGKKAEEAKRIELKGWDYPQHLKGRLYGLVVHGDAEGASDVRRALSDWLDAMGLVGAGTQARLDRVIGYYEPYATSHDALDRDSALQDEVRHVALAVANGVRSLRRGAELSVDQHLSRPRPK